MILYREQVKNPANFPTISEQEPLKSSNKINEERTWQWTCNIRMENGNLESIQDTQEEKLLR